MALNGAAALNAVNDVNPVSAAFDAGYEIGSGHVGGGALAAAMVLVPEGGSGVRILEREGNVILGTFRAAKGEGRFVTELVRQGDDLILRGTHVEGDATLREGLEAARSFGREQGASRVIIEGGTRTTGARPGHIPRPITLETNP